MNLKLPAYLLLFLSIQMKAAFVPIRYDNVRYEPAIQTAILTQLYTYERFPAIELNSNQQLQMRFDELKPENDNYQYTFIHCSANWEPSNLRPNEYLRGSFFENINDYSFSTTTFQIYTHYEVVFPTEEMKPKYSGNYLLKIYRNYDENDIILTHRFMVVDNKFLITGMPKRATNPNFRSTMQEIDFAIDLGNAVVPNPLIDVKTTIMQNLRWDNAVYNLKPRFVNGLILDYNYEEGNLFDGGNEFRYFDIRSLRALSYNVRRKYMENNVKNVLLYSDACKMNQPYLTTIDYNGKRVIDNKDGAVAGGEIEGDYCDVIFTYISDKIDKDVYVFAELSDWEIKKEFKMEYNENFNQYELKVRLKQAYYNYYIVTTKPDDPDKKIELIYTEGNFSVTENDYYIMAYTKNQFMQFDELLGTFHCNTRGNK